MDSSTHFDERFVSAFFTGSSLGSLVAGLLGLVQGGLRGFTPKPFHLVVACLLAPSAAAWLWILHRVPRKPSAAGRGHPPAPGVSLVPDAEAKAHAPPQSSAEAAAEEEAHPHHPHAGAAPPAVGSADDVQLVVRGSTRLPDWVAASLPAWLLAVPMNATTWGFSPYVSNFVCSESGLEPSRLWSCSLKGQRSDHPS